MVIVDDVELMRSIALRDRNMPSMNEITIATELRARENDVRFGFATSEGRDAIRAQATEAGAAFPIAKPFKPEEIDAVLAA